MDNEIIIGDREQFAISYRDAHDEYDPASKTAICHLVIGNRSIGNASEECHLPTWIFSLLHNRNEIVANKDDLYPKEFNGLTDREIFEMIVKSNQPEDEFHPGFLHLPKLDNVIWLRHFFTLDETTDRYQICFYVKDSQLTFLVEDNSANADPNSRSDLFFSHSVPLASFADAVDNTILFLQ